MPRARLIAFAAPIALASCGQQSDEIAATEVRQALTYAVRSAGAGFSESEAQQAGARVSRFTKLTGACKLVHDDEETGDWERACTGVSGYSLQWSSGDLREDLGVVADGKATQLELPSLVTNGAFDWLGETVEWRGPKGQPPDVLVTRVHFSRQDGTSDVGSLAIARLGRSPCVVAIVQPGPDQSKRARAVADQKLPACIEHREVSELNLLSRK